MKEQPIYSSSLPLGLKDCSFVPLKSWLTSVWHAARQRVTYAMRWKTPGPMCSQNRSELQVPILAEWEPFRTLGSFQEREQAVTWLMVVGRTPSEAPRAPEHRLQASFEQQQSHRDDCNGAASNWCPSEAHSSQWDSRWKFTSYPLQLLNYSYCGKVQKLKVSKRNPL